MSKQYDLLLRLLVIGDSGVGKTCLLSRYVDDNFQSSYSATIGIDFKVKNLTIDGRRVRVQIWDTAGQERFEAITKQYYRRAQGVILVYDITNAQSFRHINKWLDFVRNHGKENVDVTLVANKTDLDEWREVPFDAGNEFAAKHAFDFFETSAYMDANSLDEVFNSLLCRVLSNQSAEFAKQTIQSYPSESDDDDIHSTTLGEKKEKKKCC